MDYQGLPLNPKSLRQFLRMAVRQENKISRTLLSPIDRNCLKGRVRLQFTLGVGSVLRSRPRFEPITMNHLNLCTGITTTMSRYRVCQQPVSRICGSIFLIRDMLLSLFTLYSVLSEQITISS